MYRDANPVPALEPAGSPATRAGTGIAPVAEGGAANPFDPRLLLERMEGDAELVRELQELFRDDARALEAELADASDEDRARVAARVGHALRGAAVNVGAFGFRDLGLALEVSAPEGVLLLQGEFRARLRELDAFLTA